MPRKIQQILRRNAHPARASRLKRHKVGNGGEDGGVKGIDGWGVAHGASVAIIGIGG